MLLDFLSWREALLTNDGQRYYRAADMLKDAGLEYRAKVRSMNRGGSRMGANPYVFVPNLCKETAA